MGSAGRSRGDGRAGLGDAALGVVWLSSFEVGGVQAINFSDAGKARTDSNALTDIGSTEVSTDVSLFVSWLEAAEPELSDGDVRGATRGDGLGPFLYQNFPERLRVATDDWLVQRGRDEAPGLPFDLDSYEVVALQQAQVLRDDAADFG